MTAASASNAVLPMPGGPSTSRTCPRPASSLPRAAVTAASSASRPRSEGARGRFIPRAGLRLFPASATMIHITTNHWKSLPPRRRLKDGVTRRRPGGTGHPDACRAGRSSARVDHLRRGVNRGLLVAVGSQELGEHGEQLVGGLLGDEVAGAG